MCLQPDLSNPLFDEPMQINSAHAHAMNANVGAAGRLETTMFGPAAGGVGGVGGVASSRFYRPATNLYHNLNAQQQATARRRAPPSKRNADDV